MITRTIKVHFALTVIFFLATAAFSQEIETIKLPAPETDGGKPLMQALMERKSSRAFATQPFSLQVISNLLWTANGVNRPDSGKRTAPSAHNWQETDVYLANADGLYLYDATAHALHPVLSKDIRAHTGKQGFVESAPINLVYVADFSKMGNASSDDKIVYSAAGAGFIAQNVYLFCASEGLSTVVRASIDRNKLAGIMKLKPSQKIILAQTIGYPR